MTENANPRALAVKSLCAWRKNGKYTNLEVSATLDRSELSAPDRALYTNIVYGTAERAVTLDYIVSVFSSRPAEKIDTLTLCALEAGLYQLIYLDRVPDHAAVSETVAAVPRKSKAFVNAVLRSFIRAGKKYPLPEDAGERAAVEYSTPKELIAFWREGYPGRELSLAAASLRRPKTYLRLNTLKTDAASCLSLLGESAESCPAAEDVIAFSGDAAILRDGIARGLWFVEDITSYLAVKALAPAPGSVLADCCAAPGGKSFSAAIEMENRGSVYSFDLHENKLSLIKTGAERLGIGIIEAAANDARHPVPYLIGKADYLLCDAPCSGLGVISKKPDIKYKDLGQLERFPEIQYEILSASADYVRPGGALVYSTCTLNPKENGGVFTRFLREHPDFCASDFTVTGRNSTDGMYTFFPDEGEWDGFFIARAVRKAE